ncbi:MAG: hypothetical protein OHK0038_17170 [Flammeovirgaceae bacterium]
MSTEKENIEIIKKTVKEAIKKKEREKRVYRKTLKTAENCLNKEIHINLVAKITDLLLKTLKKIAKKISNELITVKRYKKTSCAFFY